MNASELNTRLMCLLDTYRAAKDDGLREVAREALMKTIRMCGPVQEAREPSGEGRHGAVG